MIKITVVLFSLNFNIYRGNFHSHTRYSDGAGTPQIAFTIARDSLGLDFYAITDHAELLNDSEWVDIMIKAKQFTQQGEFIAIHGFEWDNRLDGSYPDSGHGDIIVWNSERYAGTQLIDTTGEHFYYDSIPLLSDFYNWISNQPDSVFAAFAHPAIYLGPFVFDSLAYGGMSADSHIMGIEVFNAHWIHNGYSYDFFKQFYFLALSKGWHLGPMGNWDNHTLNPSILRRTGVRTAILAENLTKDEIFSALRNLRFYATDDKNMEFYFNAIVDNDTFPMGSELESNRVDFEIILYNPDFENFLFLKIYLNGSEIINEPLYSYAETLNYSFTITDSSYFVAEVMDEDTNYAISSPIWVYPLTNVKERNKNKQSLWTSLSHGFNKNIHICYNLHFKTHGNLSIYNIAGQRIPNSFGKIQESGIYFVRLKIGDTLIIKKLLFLR